MARLRQAPRSSFDDPEDLEAYDAVVRRRVAMGMTEPSGQAADVPDLGQYWNGLINSPRLCALAARMGTFIRTAPERPGSYSHADREFVDQVLSADFETNILQRVHVPDAVAAGVRVEAIEALHHGREEQLTEDEQLLARFIRQVVAGTVDDDTFSLAQQRLGVRGLVEYAGLVLWLQWIMRMMQVSGIDDPTDREVDAMIEGFRDGSITPPDFRARIG
jgi:hypothetical protein